MKLRSDWTEKKRNENLKLNIAPMTANSLLLRTSSLHWNGFRVMKLIIDDKMKARTIRETGRRRGTFVFEQFDHWLCRCHHRCCKKVGFYALSKSFLAFFGGIRSESSCSKTPWKPFLKEL